MKAVLLCAGFGTRLYPLTRDMAKPLLEVAGKPIVEHLVAQLSRTGRTKDIVLVSNARFFSQFQPWAAAISKRFPDVTFEVLNDGALDNEHRLGTVRDLAFALDQKNTQEAVLVVAADNLYDFSFYTFFEDYFTNPRNLILVYREKNLQCLRRTGIAKVDQDGRLLQFWEKPTEPPTDLACPAFYILETRALNLLSTYLDTVPDTDAIGHFIAWLAEREPVYTHEMKGRRLDVGNIDSYRSAESWLRETGGAQDVL
jgi:glucose-1-phosphate thymidylyltransferase